MVRRFSRLVASLAIAPAALVGCRQDAPDPIGVQSVQLAIVDGADQGGRPYATGLSQEVTSSPVFSGDPDGTGSALVTVNHGQGEICWDVSVASITLPATASHIHKAVDGVRGPIVVGLIAPNAAGRSTGCLAGVDRALLRSILTHPDSFYVNVHTTDFPPGAVRGQLGH